MYERPKVSRVVARRVCELTVVACVGVGVAVLMWPPSKPAPTVEFNTVLVPVPVAPGGGSTQPEGPAPQSPSVPVMPVRPTSTPMEA